MRAGERLADVVREDDADLRGDAEPVRDQVPNVVGEEKPLAVTDFKGERELLAHTEPVLEAPGLLEFVGVSVERNDLLAQEDRLSLAEPLPDAEGGGDALNEGDAVPELLCDTDTLEESLLLPEAVAQKEFVGADVTVGDCVTDTTVVIVCVIVKSSERVAVKEGGALNEAVTVAVTVFTAVFEEQGDGG